ncbi:BOMB/KIRA PROTEINS [Salix viminalis]|uniref:BOMB/KIRA PROTEINS n=1 Tax=Salix viminalis TaxID=40686 RepID=A0A9Q0ZC52_SALVM|nr:BOMB/KIRA PROTEINS [Salix viminalis]
MVLWLKFEKVTDEIGLEVAIVCSLFSEKVRAVHHQNLRNNPSRKRKFLSDQHLLRNGSPIQASVDLHVRDPLPLDWEQCLDLQSGRMYYLKQKNIKKELELAQEPKARP